MQAFLMVVQVLLSISLIGLILIQHGKGADAGAAFGSGASSTVFGASGSASFLSRATAILATLFFAVSLSLTILAHRQTADVDLVDKYKTPETAVVEQATETPKSDVPVAPAAPKADKSDIPAPVEDMPMTENKDKS